MFSFPPPEAPNVHSHLAVEAMAGLAAKEDFSQVQLKRDNTNIPNADFVPYKRGERRQPMLLQVKGRRPCQIRLVKPDVSSVNSGDAYILLNGDPNPVKSEIYVWLGKFVNAIEKSHAADAAQAILQQKDLGCKASKIHTLEEEKTYLSSGLNKKFWHLLGCSNPPAKVTPCPKGHWPI